MTVLYLLDANVLIDANRDYYPLDRVPEFWDWLLQMTQLGRVKVPEEIYEEIVLPKPSRPDALADWLRDHKDDLVLNEQVRPDLLAQVIDEGYADNLTDEEIENIGRDPFLIAYALVDPLERCVVTTERSKPSRKRANKHLPDVGGGVHVDCKNTFELIQELDFRTSRGSRL